MMKAGIAGPWINAGCVDPQVSLPDGSKGSLFDAVEDMDASECLEKLSQLFKLAPPAAAGPKNQAFVFIKPHAVTKKVKALVQKGLTAKGLKIVKEGSISS